MRIKKNSITNLLEFCCPGCGLIHNINIIPDIGKPVWDFNENYEAPTFSPSIFVKYYTKGVEQICHSFVKDGTIQFLQDCSHELAGITVNMYEIINGSASISSTNTH